VIAVYVKHRINLGKPKTKSYRPDLDHVTLLADLVIMNIHHVDICQTYGIVCP